MNKPLIRWSQLQPGDVLAHPDAVAQAMAMEGHGYEQVDLSDLTDQEDVALLSGQDGGVALARYHRTGQDADSNGRRSEHVFEAWPGSAHSDMLPYADTMRQTQAGEQVSRLAIFRAAHPELARHGLPLYAARDRLGN